MARPRLFYVLDSLEENEVGDQVATLLGRLPRSRFEPRVVALGPQGLLGDRIRRMKVAVHELELSGAVGAILAVPRLRKLLSGLDADILQTFQPWSGTVAQLAAPRNTAVFRWVRGLPPPPANLEERIQAWLERRSSLHRGRHFIASDDSVVECVRSRYGVDHVDVVPECVDVARVRDQVRAISMRDARIHLGLSNGERVVVTVSDFRDRAKMGQLLEGFATARREAAGLRLFLQGRGPEEGHVRAQAEDLRLDDSVIFLGNMRDRALLRAAEVVVDAGSSPGWSRCSMEAMALELPVLRWVDDEGQPDAQRYPARTTGPADRFARDVLDILEDTPLQARVASQALAHAQAHDVATVADQWAEVYGA